MLSQRSAVAVHGGECIGNEALVGFSIILGLEVIQAVDAVEVFLGKPVAPLAVAFAFVPLLAAQELQAILIILSTVSMSITLVQ